MPTGVWTTEHLTNPYEVDGISVDHEWHEGTCLLPVAGPPGTAAELVRLHAPYGVRRTHSYGLRTGAVPSLPDPTVIPAGSVLAEYTVTLAAPELDTDAATRIHQNRCEAVYYLSLPRSPNDGYDYPCFPYDGTGSAGNTVTSASFNATIFPALAAPAGNPGGGMGRTS